VSRDDSGVALNFLDVTPCSLVDTYQGFVKPVSSICSREGGASNVSTYPPSYTTSHSPPC